MAYYYPNRFSSASLNILRMSLARKSMGALSRLSTKFKLFILMNLEVGVNDAWITELLTQIFQTIAKYSLELERKGLQSKLGELSLVTGLNKRSEDKQLQLSQLERLMLSALTQEQLIGLFSVNTLQEIAVFLNIEVRGKKRTALASAICAQLASPETDVFPSG